jgi:hypothetical protein
MKKLKPKCISGEIQVAMTNRGELIPCCYLDTIYSLNTPEIKKLLKVSKLDDVEKIEEIIFSDEWIEFKKNLENDKGPPGCFHVCGTHHKENKTKKLTTYYKGRELSKEEV